jgi:hypothetical protein
MGEKNKLESPLSQVSTLLEATNETMKRLADDNEEMRGLLQRLANSSDRHAHVAEEH